MNEIGLFVSLLLEILIWMCLCISIACKRLLVDFLSGGCRGSINTLLFSVQEKIKVAIWLSYSWRTKWQQLLFKSARLPEVLESICPDWPARPKESQLNDIHAQIMFWRICSSWPGNRRNPIRFQEKVEMCCCRIWSHWKERPHISAELLWHKVRMAPHFRCVKTCWTLISL